jgi:hypothetical protein
MDCVTSFSNMVGITYVTDTKLSVVDDQLFYYKFIFKQNGKTSSSSIYVMRMTDLDQSIWYSPSI